MYLFLTVLAAFSFSIGGVFMKLAAGLTRPAASLALFACFVTGAACQTLAMKYADMGVAYLFVLGLEALVAFLLSVLWLHEPFSGTRVAAVILIVAGIVLLHVQRG